jgi:hypothetical protein
MFLEFSCREALAVNLTAARRYISARRHSAPEPSVANGFTTPRRPEPTTVLRLVTRKADHRLDGPLEVWENNNVKIQKSGSERQVFGILRRDLA